MRAVELEAIQWRADWGFVPYKLWAALTDGERARVGELQAGRARRILQDPRELARYLDDQANPPA